MLTFSNPGVGEAFVQADFANEFIGGGVLGRGCVQEEIRFVICPELIVSMLFAERMENNECIVITGAEMFSEYTGYANSYRFKGDHVDTIARDRLHRKMTQIVAMDAQPYFKERFDQYAAQNIDRDLRKAFVAFESTCPRATIATGNWGCGAFGGDPQLKVRPRKLTTTDHDKICRHVQQKTTLFEILTFSL